VTKPFDFEGKRTRVAKEGIQELIKHVDSLITIPNEKLMGVLGEDVTFVEAFGAANNVLFSAVAGIAEIINSPGMINVDFADVKTVMSEMGMAMIGSGFSEGSDRAIIAAKAAVACPLLEDVNLNNAKGILVNISASRDFKMKEYFEVMEIIKQYAAEEANIIVGNVIDDTMANGIRVTMVATGLNNNSSAQQEESDDVMTSFVYEDESSETTADEADDKKESDVLNVFTDNSENNLDRMRSEAEDEYDIPSFLRNNK